jgi:hypothetical protein
MKPKEERRNRVWRRQFNQSFMDEHGNVMVAKVIAVAAQIMLLYQTSKHFEAMLGKSDTLLVVLSLLILPDLARKWMNMRFGNGHTAATTKGQ